MNWISTSPLIYKQLLTMSTDNFIWTDELVKEFMLTYNKIDKLIDGVDPIIKTMQEWKVSKQQSTDWEIVKRKHFGLHQVGRDCDCPIISVRRLSDGCVFTVNQDVDYVV